MKTMNVLGVTIDEYPLKELLKIASESLAGPNVCTMSWVSGSVLLSLDDDAFQKEWLEDIDITLGMINVNLKNGRLARLTDDDGKNRDFMDNYFKYLSNTGVEPAIVCDNAERLEHFKEWLKKINPKFKISSEHIFDSMDDKDELFNKLNGEGQRIVLVCVPWTIEGPLLMNAHHVSNTPVWLSVLPEMIIDMDCKKKRFDSIFDGWVFRRRVKKYSKTNKENK